MGCALDGINYLQMILTGRWHLVRRLPLPQARAPDKEVQVSFYLSSVVLILLKIETKEFFKLTYNPTDQSTNQDVTNQPASQPTNQLTKQPTNNQPTN